jgi:hypothetical protein
MYARTTAEPFQWHAGKDRNKTFDLSKAVSFHILSDLLFTERPAICSCIKWNIYRVCKWTVDKHDLVLVFVLVFGMHNCNRSCPKRCDTLKTQAFRSLHLVHLQFWYQLALLLLEFHTDLVCSIRLSTE